MVIVDVFDFVSLKVKENASKISPESMMAWFEIRLYKKSKTNNNNKLRSEWWEKPAGQRGKGRAFHSVVRQEKEGRSEWWSLVTMEKSGWCWVAGDAEVGMPDHVVISGTQGQGKHRGYNSLPFLMNSLAFVTYLTSASSCQVCHLHCPLLPDLMDWISSLSRAVLGGWERECCCISEAKLWFSFYYWLGQSSL